MSPASPASRRTPTGRRPTYEGDAARNLARVGRDRHPDPAEHAAEVLEPGLPAAGRDRGPRAAASPTPSTSGRTSGSRSGWPAARSSRCPTRFGPCGRPATCPGSSPTTSRFPWTPPTVWAEGGMWSCVADLARWISFQLREDGGERSGAQVLAGSTLKEMHTPRYLGDAAWTEAWCISWYARRRGDVVWVQHSGGLHGFITNVCFHPEDRVGAIALINGVGNASELAMDLATIARDAVNAAPVAIEPPAPAPGRLPLAARALPRPPRGRHRPAGVARREAHHGRPRRTHVAAGAAAHGRGRRRSSSSPACASRASASCSTACPTAASRRCTSRPRRSSGSTR